MVVNRRKGLLQVAGPGAVDLKLAAPPNDVSGASSISFSSGNGVLHSAPRFITANEHPSAVNFSK